MSTAPEAMTEAYKKSLCNEVENNGKDHTKTDTSRFASVPKSFFRWPVYVSLTALVVFVVGVFFQMQLVALQQELAALKENFTCEEKSRNLRKRSSTENEGAVIQAAHFQGTFAFQHVEKQGIIGPWSVSSTEGTFMSLKKRNTEIKISQKGVYYVYAQIYYLTSELHNSFQILTYNGTEERKYHRNLATCSSQGSNSIGEVSCYTGFTASFRSGERLYLNQIEQNRIIHFANGSSYFGMILLKKNAELKPKIG